jgi:hypothetical protein
LARLRQCSAAKRERALQVHLDDRVPLLLGHREQHAVTEDAGVVDQHVQTAERVDRLGDEALGPVPRADVIGVRRGLATEGLDLVHDLLRGAGIAAAAVACATEVVHDDLPALGSEHHRVLATDASTGARDDAHPAFDHSLFHRCSLVHRTVLIRRSGDGR